MHKNVGRVKETQVRVQMLRLQSSAALEGARAKGRFWGLERVGSRGQHGLASEALPEWAPGTCVRIQPSPLPMKVTEQESTTPRTPRKGRGDEAGQGEENACRPIPCCSEKEL